MTSVFIISEEENILCWKNSSFFILLSCVTETNFPIVYCLPSSGSDVHNEKVFQALKYFYWMIILSFSLKQSSKMALLRPVTAFAGGLKPVPPVHKIKLSMRSQQTVLNIVIPGSCQFKQSSSMAKNLLCSHPFKLLLVFSLWWNPDLTKVSNVHPGHRYCHHLKAKLLKSLTNLVSLQRVI